MLEKSEQGQQDLMILWICDPGWPLGVWPEEWVYGGVD